VLRIQNIRNIPEFNPPLKIMSFDIENAIQKGPDEEYGQIFVIGYSLTDGKTTEKGSVSGKERDLLRDFVKLVNSKDPDLLTGYNIDGYDLPVLKYRMERNGVRFGIGRDHQSPHRVQGQYWRLHGRIISDTWWGVKKVLHPKHESLNYVSRELLGEGKDNINRLKIEEEWATRPDEVTQYCIKDADLTLRIFEKIRIVDRNMFMSTVAKLPLDDVTNGGTSNYVDSLLIRKADREGIGVPMTKHNYKEAPIEGGYVHSIGAGIYDYVVVLDFKSMYPSMIMKYNICFTTFDPSGEIVAPNGVHFLARERREGLVPRLLKELMDQRDAVKRQMKTASTGEKEYLDGVQGIAEGAHGSEGCREEADEDGQSRRKGIPGWRAGGHQDPHEHILRRSGILILQIHKSGHRRCGYGVRQENNNFTYRKAQKRELPGHIRGY
jgi:DNA polymerase I